MRQRIGLLALALLLAVQTARTAAPPKLLVILVVDQMRADYVQRFERDWTSGLKRLVTNGAVFTRAAYPYLTTVTCAGHATIGTGAFPHTHGIFQNIWYDRERANVFSCTEDASVTSLLYGGSSGGGESARKLLVPSFADEMRRQRGSRVVSLALKARSAIMMAGHGGDAVTWVSDALDGWETSSAFAPELVPAVQAYVTAHPMASDFGKTWERLLPADRYPEPDAGLSEASPDGWTSTFPHVLNGTGEAAPTIDFYEQWQRSPFADAYVGRMAAGLVESMKLGQGTTQDVLAVSFSTPDLVGHQFGPDSQEIHDIYVQLDRTVGTLLDRLDRLVGPDRYVVALSADHAVTPIPEQLTAAGRDAGRISTVGLSRAVQQAAETALGAGTYVARVYSNDIYFRPGVWEQLLANPAAMKAVVDAASSARGVERVFRRDELGRAALNSTDRLLRAAALGYAPDRGGDLVLALKSGWMTAVDGTTHGSANPDDQQVPLILFGPDIKPGKYRTRHHQPTSHPRLQKLPASSCQWPKAVRLPQPWPCLSHLVRETRPHRFRCKSTFGRTTDSSRTCGNVRRYCANRRKTCRCACRGQHHARLRSPGRAMSSRHRVGWKAWRLRWERVDQARPADGRGGNVPRHTRCNERVRLATAPPMRFYNRSIIVRRSRGDAMRHATIAGALSAILALPTASAFAQGAAARPAAAAAAATPAPAGTGLGSITLPRKVMADGQPLAAGTYQVRLTGEEAKPAAGQSPDAERYIEFLRAGKVVGREVATVVSNADMPSIAKGGKVAAGSARVERLKGDDYIRVWINRGGHNYLVHLPPGT